MTNTRVLLVALGAAIVGRRADCQATDTSELTRAKHLVVHVSAPPREAHGAGIIVGVSREFIYVATARHVLDMLRSPTAVRVAFLGDSLTVPAMVAPKTYARDTTLFDIGLLIVRRADVTALKRTVDLDQLELDRLADVGRLHPGEKVYSIGCPRGICWETPADETVFGLGEHMTFLTQFVAPGNSGGALLSEWGEVVGMVVESEPPVGRAINVDALLRRLRSLDAMISLRRPSVPRWPYDVEMHSDLLTSGGDDHSRVPSGLIGLDVRLAEHFAWHVDALRLVPENATITSLLAGGSAPMTSGRFTLSPFVDVGLARIDARHDLGGFYTGVPGALVYTPAWEATNAFGFGAGGGLRAAVIAMPRLSIELVAAHWSFQLPLDSPTTPSWYGGAGVRWAIR